MPSLSPRIQFGIQSDSLSCASSIFRLTRLVSLYSLDLCPVLFTNPQCVLVASWTVRARAQWSRI